MYSRFMKAVPGREPLVPGPRAFSAPANGGSQGGSGCVLMAYGLDPQQANPEQRSSSGLLEFEDLADAVNALIYCNHAPIKNPDSKFPYMMKLCFSSSRSITANGGSGFKEETQ
ncbi:unnamed protein product [Nezara viridula]|uniref:Heterogeneous nuclear ribonucleoprotein L RRM domain-containing protein n=1 Tax=Nezara viridula TaxID=85310 RepID=A0A9P0MP20_NEZVI|nr:unnamed protein product [Nezara viridula]